MISGNKVRSGIRRTLAWAFVLIALMAGCTGPGTGRSNNTTGNSNTMGSNSTRGSLSNHTQSSGGSNPFLVPGSKYTN